MVNFRDSSRRTSKRVGDQNAEPPKKVIIPVRIDETLLEKMKVLRIKPSEVVKGAIKKEIMRREKERELREVQLKDPRITAMNLRSSSTRTRRLRGL